MGGGRGGGEGGREQTRPKDFVDRVDQLTHPAMSERW